MTRKKNPAYTEEFRREAVKRSEKPGVTQAMVAKELGISAQQIANWKRQFTRLSDKQFNSVDGVDYSKKESEELRKLRRENKRLQEEMAFLKKAAAYLCPVGTSRTTKNEVRAHTPACGRFFRCVDVSCIERVTLRILSLARCTTKH